MMKKILALFLVLILSGLIISGCSQKTEMKSEAKSDVHQNDEVPDEEVDQATPEFISEGEEISIGEVI